MTLQKTEYTTRTRIISGEETNEVTNESYNVLNEAGDNIGHVQVHTTGFNFNINEPGTTAEIRAQVSTLLAEMAALTTPQEGE